MKRAVIVGGGGAGDAAAFGLRKKGFDGEIEIISADTDRPYDRPYLSKEFIRGEVELEKVYLHEEGDYDAQKIRLFTGAKVTGGSLRERKLTLESGGEVGFDELVLALGGTPRKLPGIRDAANVFTLRSLRDGSAIRDALGGGSRLMLVGAGFIGAEVGASARKLGKDVLMVEAAPVPLSRALGEEVGEIYAGIHRAQGVDVRTGTTVKEWHTTGGRVTGATLSDGTREEADVVLIGVGIEPNLELPKALGLAVDGGGVRVDEGLKAVEGVHVAGDIAIHRHPVLGRDIRVEHWEVAKGHGRGVAASITGGGVPYKTIPYFWSDQYDVNLEYRGNASGEDRLIWRGDRESPTFSVFYVRDGLIEAVLSMNDAKTNELGGKLLAKRHPVDPELLADESSDLALAAADAG